MTHIWSGLSKHHLLAYPSRMQVLFSQRKDNVPKRCFPHNLGQESGTALPSALSQETRPTVLNGSFPRFKQAISHLHMLVLFSGPPRDAIKLSPLQVDLRTPQSISTVLCQHQKAQQPLLFDTPIFVNWVHYLDGHPSKETDKNWSPIT